MTIPTNPTFSFGSGFLADHAGQIISDPMIAIVELVANAYDAGAGRVEITWPAELGGKFEIVDDGCGMTSDQFERRWKRFNYSRTQEQGPLAEFPIGVKHRSPRTAFGQSGKGRHGAFCFGDSYHVETWRDGQVTTTKVTRIDSDEAPFRFDPGQRSTRNGHGTRIWANVERNQIAEQQIEETIGAKFLVDPTLSISLNGREMVLSDLTGLNSISVDVAHHGTIRIHQITSADHDRNTRLRGITWWVQGRRVGEPTWEILSGEPLLDGRQSLAKRVSFVVEADFLKQDVRADWSTFFDSQRTVDTRTVVHQRVTRAISDLLASTRDERKRAAIVENSKTISTLPAQGRRTIGRFVDQVQEQCHSITEKDLSRTVRILANLERARTRYDLLQQLESCSPEDLDRWNAILTRWTSGEAEVVLGELDLRLRLLDRLGKLVNAPTTDELHTLQPLFARGLWMFGPEYEAVDFMSNRYLATTIRQHLGGFDKRPANVRPDVVAVADGTIGVYSADEYDGDGGEVCGYRKVLVVELKRGGFSVSVQELRQGEDYASELRKAARVQPTTEIVVYVLGAELEGDAREERRIGDHTRVKPMRYDDLLRRANSRTFNLKDKIAAIAPNPDVDKDVEAALATASLQTSLYEEVPA